jgi:hypothetical protein
LNDWPLAVCDAAAVDKTTDLEAADLLYPDLATENYQVYYKPEYKWYYLSSHDVSELMIFKQSDSLPDACPGMSFQVKAPPRVMTLKIGVPHCSFLNPLTPREEAPRESIEARALVYYDD